MVAFKSRPNRIRPRGQKRGWRWDMLGFKPPFRPERPVLEEPPPPAEQLQTGTSVEEGD